MIFLMAKKLTPEEDILRVSKMRELEDEKHAAGFKYIAGVDEAGRGPLAGPVYAAAVILPENTYIEGINDSKKLSAAKREKLYDEIIEKAAAYHISAVDEEVIDEINILNATFEAMKNAVSQLTPSADYVLIDGNRMPPDMPIPGETVVKGDSKSISIAAASILAKVSRDRYISEQDKLYPGYGFAKHKGYGTKQHIEAIKQLGPCKIHRKTFIKNFI